MVAARGSDMCLSYTNHLSGMILHTSGHAQVTVVTEFVGFSDGSDIIFELEIFYFREKRSCVLIALNTIRL